MSVTTAARSPATGFDSIESGGRQSTGGSVSAPASGAAGVQG